MADLRQIVFRQTGHSHDGITVNAVLQHGEGNFQLTFIASFLPAQLDTLLDILDHNQRINHVSRTQPKLQGISIILMATARYCIRTQWFKNGQTGCNVCHLLSTLNKGLEAARLCNLS